ncbi:MAG TPA: hypothetical protein PKE45_06005, partial [Caldilineaceae bacterium]|nr:hypothetical protein [Caldilineaceae bacterium]
MNGIVPFVKRHPLAVFVVLTYALSWWPTLLYVWGMSSVGVAAFGPFLAALVVLSLTEGKSGVKTLLGRMVRWRVGWQWYLFALGLPVLLGILASYLVVWLGAPAISAAQLAGWPTILMIFPFSLLVPGLGGAW